MTAPVSFGAPGIRRGFLRAQVLTPGVFVYGIGFGMVADQAGLSAMQSLLFSALVYSGSAQMAALGVLAAGVSTLSATVWAIVALILVINARYVLFGATLRPWLGQVPARFSYPSLFILGDGSWMMSLRAHEAGERDAGFILGASLSGTFAWLAGTVVGSLLGGSAPSPRALGLDFLLVAFSAAMMVGMFRNRADLVVIAAAVIVAGLLVWVGQPGWAPVVAGIAGGAVAWLRFEVAAKA